MEAYIIQGYRSAVGKAKKGGFKNYRSDDLAVQVIQHLMQAVPQVDPKQVMMLLWAAPIQKENKDFR